MLSVKSGTFTAIKFKAQEKNSKQLDLYLKDTFGLNKNENADLEDLLYDFELQIVERRIKFEEDMDNLLAQHKKCPNPNLEKEMKDLRAGYDKDRTKLDAQYADLCLELYGSKDEIEKFESLREKRADRP